jgi:mono/diheme cytochrome c family protein
MKFKIAIASIATSCLLASHVALAADATKGGAIYAQRCAMCHGDKGAGDGPVAATIPEGQKPRNLAAGDYKYATDDAKFKELLQKGGAGVGLSVLMPAQSDLKPAEVDDLMAFVKSLKK